MSHTRRRIITMYVSLMLSLASAGLAQAEISADQAPAPAPTPSPAKAIVVLVDGSRLIGEILSDDGTQMRFKTRSGLALTLEISQIARVERQGPFAPGQQADRFWRHDPNDFRLLVAPTGRPIARGEAVFGDTYLVLPSLTVGVTDHFSVMAGVSTLPGIGLTEQLMYITPRVSYQPSKDVALSVGLLYASVGEDTDRVGAGIAFAVGTFGSRKSSLTTGIGWGYIIDDGEAEIHEAPILLCGFSHQLSNNLALISENWLVLGDDFDLNQQPFALALRFFGERLSVDAGFVLVGEVLEEGFPIPWVSFAYRFGKPHAKRR